MFQTIFESYSLDILEKGEFLRTEKTLKVEKVASSKSSLKQLPEILYMFFSEILKNHTHFLSHTHFENEYDL